MTVTIQQVSVGFDTYETFINSAVAEAANNSYPPYNIRKTSNTQYAIDIDVSGFHSSNIKAHIENGYLTVSSNGVLSVFGSNTDVFFNKGIQEPVDFHAKYWIADGLKLSNAVYLDGVVTFTFDSTQNNITPQDVTISYALPAEGSVVVNPAPEAPVANVAVANVVVSSPEPAPAEPTPTVAPAPAQ